MSLRTRQSRKIFTDLSLRLLISNSLVADGFQSVHAVPEDLGMKWS